MHKPPLPKNFSRKTQVELLEFGEAIPRFPSKEELAQLSALKTDAEKEEWVRRLRTAATIPLCK